MSNDQQIHSGEPAAMGSCPVSTPEDDPPRDELRDKCPATTSERYWRLFNDPGLSPPDAPVGPPPVSPETFHDLVHQVRALAGVVLTIIPLVSQSMPPHVIQPLQPREPHAWTRASLPERPILPRNRTTQLGNREAEDMSSRPEPEVPPTDSTNTLRAQLRLFNQRLDEVQ